MRLLSDPSWVFFAFSVLTFAVASAESSWIMAAFRSMRALYCSFWSLERLMGRIISCCRLMNRRMSQFDEEEEENGRREETNLGRKFEDVGLDSSEEAGG
jgi:hypothetical protein